jgi:iron complex outermembrane receptor protein
MSRPAQVGPGDISVHRLAPAAGGALSLAALLLARPAHAQAIPATTQTIELPPVTVTARPAGSLTVPGLELQRESIDQTAGSVEWINSESYKNSYSNTLRDTLKNTPGVYVQNRYGQEIRLSIRGSGIGRAYHVRGLELLQDGIPVNLADGSGDYYQLDPLAFRSIEVFKGGNGLAYGSSTLGGAINFVSPTAYTAVAPNMVRLDGGSFGTVRLNGQLSRAFGDFDVLGNLTLTHSDGYRDHSRQQALQFNANAGYRINENVETRFYVGAYFVAQELPGTLTLSQALNNPTMAAPAAVSGDQSRETWTERVANRTTVALDTGKLDIDTWFIHKKLFHPIFQVIDQDGITYGIGARYTGSFDLGGFRDDVIAGVRFFGGNNTALQYVNVGGSRGAQTLNARQNAYDYQAYFENRFFFLPTVALMAGAKALIDQRDYMDEGGGLSSSRGYANLGKTYSGFNPKIGLLWQPREDIQAFVDLTRSQDVPDFTDLVQTQANGATGFVPLQSQRAWTVEIGTRGKYDRFAWDVTAYRSTVNGQLLQFTTSPNSILASTFNAGTTIIQGIELGASADIVRDVSGPGAGDRITLSQLWNYTDAHFQNDPQYGDNKLAGLPPHILRTTLTYTHPSGFYFAPSLDIVPVGMYADFANTLQVPAYSLFGVQTGFDFGDGSLVYLDARNLTNKRYISDLGTITNAQQVSSAVFYPGDGLSIYAGARLAF